MAKHSKEQREYIVRALAALVPAQDIAVRFMSQWTDTTCTIEDVDALDPKFGVILPPELHAEFTATRERVLTDPSAAPFAEQRARLVVLSQQAADYHARKDYPNVRAVFRQIAEETGDVTSGKGGKVVAPTGKDAESVTEIQRIVVYPPDVPADQKAR